MLFFVLRQRHEGRLIARHSLSIDHSVHGELSVREALDPVLRRTCRVARLVKPEAPQVELVPPLKDANLLYVDAYRFVLTGFEHLLDRDYAQTWMLTLDPDSFHALHPIGGKPRS